MADAVRPDAAGIVQRLRTEGVRHVAMVSGDRRSLAERVGREVGVDLVYAEQSADESSASCGRSIASPSSDA